MYRSVELTTLCLQSPGAARIDSTSGGYDVSAIDDLLANNQSYASTRSPGSGPMSPAKRIAVVACMDARLDTGALLGLVEGDAHVLRNAGGVVTDDVIRSLAISQRLAGTREIMLIHHTDCGMLTVTDAELTQQISEGTGLERHALSRRRPRPVLAVGGRLGRERRQRSPPDHQGAGDGAETTVPGDRPVAPLRPGLHVRERGLPGAPGCARDRLQHEPPG